MLSTWPWRWGALVLGAVAVGTACSRDEPARPIPAEPGASVESTRRTVAAPTDTLFVQGAFDREGKELLRFGPVRRLSGVAKARPARASGRFAVRVIGPAGEIAVAPFDALVAADPGAARYGFFEVVIPIAGEVGRVVIEDGRDGRVIVELRGDEIEVH